MPPGPAVRNEQGRPYPRGNISQPPPATGEQLRRKLGLSKNTVRNWELAGKLPVKFLRPAARPNELIVALAVLRDPQLSDAEARKAALSLFQQLEVAHG